MMRRTRLFLIVLLVAGLAPGLWWRMPLPPLRHDEGVTVTRLSGLPAKVGEMEVEGAWELESRNEHFGGFSALAMTDGSTLLAASDKARFMRIAVPPVRNIAAGELGYFRPSGAQDKRLSDLEALAHDPETGMIWASYENLNTIERVSADGERKTARLPGTGDWPARSGAEAIERLPDGRFVVIAESRGGDAGSPALLFPGDPLGKGEPLAFRFKGPKGYSPTGAAALPDGRLLVLMRTWRFGVPPAFRCLIVLADPAQIASGEVWTGRVVARLQPPLPSDNYEGIAVRPRADGSFTVWVISDDNFMRHQRTLLLQLRWQERTHEKARGKPRASSKFQQG